MFKFTVILFVVVWLGSLIFSRKRRVIRDVNHLIQLILAAAIFFGASTAIRSSFLHENMLFYVPALVLTFAAAWGVSLLIMNRLSAASGKQPRRQPRR
ncbi:hypothetical protein N1030_15235 [Desulfovibrio mangrovi]|uniref:hypothetical protein n=1 Tax=Desulfovibrio mangrovi TaxID=2976983 RepID=UPI002247C177|nr:hypothetical protein [Desulfovibrio mangrovi]UZP66943.1 hypothetical protein N1030_15235 [Desulfovibrio mangrovi]